jgi:hypothetical protein
MKWIAFWTLGVPGEDNNWSTLSGGRVILKQNVEAQCSMVMEHYTFVYIFTTLVPLFSVYYFI